MKRIILVVLALGLLGCATSGKPIQQDKVVQIKEGVTTKEEVIALMGKPAIHTLNGDGKEIMMYTHIKANTRASSFIPVVGLFVSGADMKQQSLQILIGKEGKVEKYIFTDSETPMNTGLANQGQ